MKIRKIVNYEDYSITEYGEVISHKSKRGDKTLKCGPSSSGYKTVTLYDSNGPITESIHVLVANAFKDEMDTVKKDKLELDHKDENKFNNHYSNLRWCTSSENSKYYHSNHPSINNSGYKPVDPLVKKANIKTRSKQLSEKFGKSLGVSVTVNGIAFDAVRQAAKYIIEAEQKQGNNRNLETVRKELQRFTQGKRPSWSMYGKYAVS